MKVATVLVVCLVCVTNQASCSILLPADIRQEETSDISASQYSSGGRGQIFEDLKKLSKSLDKTKEDIESELKNLEEAKNEQDTLKTFVEELLKRLSSGTKVQRSSRLTSSKKKNFIILKDTDLTTWYTARASCQSKGMDLASVESEEEQKELGKAIRKIGYNVEYVWIGGSDIETEGEFTWISSGRPFTYEFWDPNNGGGDTQNCLAAHGTGDDNSWADRNCEYIYPYVCEYYS